MTRLADEIRASGLGGYAYLSLDPSDPARAPLRRDFLAALAVHERRKRELLPLVAAWNIAGIEPLLFKGFHLSEFVYPVPGARFSGDVDVLVRPEQDARAVEIARALGWEVGFDSRAVGRPYIDCVATLIGPDGGTRVDLHRWLLRAHHRFNAVQRRITQAVWVTSRSREWVGTRIRELTPVDALVVGLALQRCWSDDAWRLKPHDGLDALQLVERHGVTLEAVRARARSLGAARTFDIWLARCDPFERRICRQQPTPREIKRWQRAVYRERGLLGRGENALRLLLDARAILASIRSGLPSVIAAHRSMRRHHDLGALLRSITPATASPGAADSAIDAAVRRERAIRGVRIASRILPWNRRGDCLLRSLAIYHRLRREGFPARFVSGIQQAGGGICGHAWIELDGRVLPELGESGNRQAYAVNFEFPADITS